jgi:hypothetical protein
MIPNKKLKPLKRRNENITNNTSEDLPKETKVQELRNDMDIPEFLKKIDNEQYLQMYIRMRQRHLADGAVSLMIENEDLADQNIELYDNKGINLEQVQINENIADHVEYYLESLNRDKFLKISKSFYKSEEETKEKEDTEVKLKKPIKRITEDLLFQQFDQELTKIITKTSEKVSLIFLFAQGLLAGISLINILLLLQYSNYLNFLSSYSNNVREIFNFTHALTFISLVGNGIKFISTYKRCIKYLHRLLKKHGHV